ncbi:hypothetical protein DTL21_02345 [Bremerella cremea]|uniref:Uncharacterized protein n=1 Tax=Blastopirellula marina TaxID=124 RepID=A0A2S8G591_9BACT|nr:MULTISPECIES: hypothetical protein [Pirellulaceae]PQO39606.1 hypothetical protein C5Y83_02345 [Blastopirellula marina]RCS51073.1 hypothetical protein DTL21_02345 [Bremerella cremea]
MTVLYIVIAVLVLLFGFFSYLNAANWNVLHVLGLFLTFGAGFAYLILSAAVLKTETSWKKTAEQLQEQLATQEARVEQLQHGFSIDPKTGRLNTVENETDSLSGAEAELRRVMYDRGRLWRNVNRVGVNNNQINLALPPIQSATPTDPDAPAAGPAPTQPPRSLAVNDIVYAFGQMPSPDNQSIAVPAYFIGEFVVKSVNAQNLTVEPTTKLDQTQQQVINLKNPWMLYDKMPVDEHQIFESMDDEKLAAVIRGACSRLGLPQPLADEMVVRFQRTGEPAQNDDPELAVMSKVTFEQDYEVPVDAETETSGVTQEFEPASGLAAAGFLKQGSPTKFTKGTQVIMSTTGDKGKALVDQGIVKIDERLYYRPLNDFAFQFHAYKAQVEDLQDTAYVLNKSIDMLKASEQVAKDVVAYRTQEKTKLQDDKTKVVYEQEQIAEYKTRLMDFLTQTLKTNSQLYRTNQTLVEELKRVSDAVLQKLEQEQRNQDSSSSDSLTLAN